MKKILLSLIMLCTAVSAWSYTVGSVNFVPDSKLPFSEDETTGIVVSGPTDQTKSCWKVSSTPLVITMPENYVITAVTVSAYNNQIQCDNLIFNSTGNNWVQNGTFKYFKQVKFTSASSIAATISGITIYYHMHEFTHNEGQAATYKATGMTEFWYCTDCGHTYSDEAGTNEVAKAEDLILPVNPNNHASALEKHDAVPATCVSTGIMQYWHCSDCNHCFKDEQGQTQIADDDVTTEINPDNHGDKLKEVAFKNASVIEEGIYHHWHCEACGNDYADADCTEDMNGKTVKAKYDADALLIGSKTVDESYLFSSAKVTFDGDKAILAIGSDNHQYDLSETERLAIDFSHTFKLKANQDPDHMENYYSTFYTGEGAYKVPDDGSVKAYTGKVNGDVLKLTDAGDIIKMRAPVILKASSEDITLMPSVNKSLAFTDGKFVGTDEGKTLGANQYALSLGQYGVGFYLWDGKKIGANKAYLSLNGLPVTVKAFTFEFEDGETTAINSVNENEDENENLYNLNGIRVDESYKGIVIKNGKKIYWRGQSE